MGILELFLIAIGLSMDAFAVSVCKGLNMKRVNYRHSAAIALFFGGFQALMPLCGWFLGTQFEAYITGFDHWIAFVLLVIIGGKMVYESRQRDEENGCKSEERLDLGELFILAVATSIDALAIGITFALLQTINIWFSISLIGMTTFFFAVIGVSIGNRFGTRYKSRAELAGGMILIVIGFKILMEHLGIL